ncbi:phosphoribosyl-AMP cyclohydrolase [Pseudohalioglobus lutimaris]|uniref:Phosphoribosyl-AMP cyclohydrolase n=1 Tax=Pseudohalioglobus lutimaris TaxID=1737061 RepID=A0A2N5X3Q4_9GAMM|nr:phosphoribosyl-AMP cyclohydrolase [Pseudohalioglobus lutimaris]PLW69097.1 phosphoribosyl-AMP cyclohydrolase [Pseudohalioglobus lutimaris]
MELNKEITWNEQGLVAAIAQDWKSGEVLMMAWMNAEALRLTLQEQRAIYFSRSRQSLWRKGEESGNVQRLRELRVDCDGDTVLLQVEQVGGVACHTGRRSCFYRLANSAGELTVTDEVLKNPDDMYGSKA